MENSGVSSKREMLSEKLLPGFENCKTTVSKINYVINLIGVWLFRLRKFVLAAPVIYYALKIAAYNREHLPEQVGINLQATGEFTTMISRTMAVNGPLMLTFGCLLMMFFSRKALYSWAISIFTLVLPILLLVSNLYPA